LISLVKRALFVKLSFKKLQLVDMVEPSSLITDEVDDFVVWKRTPGRSGAKYGTALVRPSGAVKLAKSLMPDGHLFVSMILSSLLCVAVALVSLPLSFSKENGCSDTKDGFEYIAA
jgi:hypothetical protein